MEKKSPSDFDTESFQVWMHVESGLITLATPWWEILRRDKVLEGTSRELSHDGLTEDTWPERKFKIGSLSQIGWLILGTGGVWIGGGPSIRQAFEYIGEL